MPGGAGDVRALLPLRYPYLMIDRVVDRTADRVEAIKNVTINEPFFVGHFPEPLPAVMPGTLIVEAMAQTAALLAVGEGAQSGYLVGIDGAHFRRRVEPGDTLVIEATRTRSRLRLIRASVEARVNGELAATATLSLLFD